MQRLPSGSDRERKTLKKLEKVAFRHFFDTLNMDASMLPQSCLSGLLAIIGHGR